MDKRSRKELIDGIKDFLRDFEEPYDRKEWQNFQRQRKSKQRKPIPLFVKLTGIAASLFLMVYASVRILPLFDGRHETRKKVSKEAPHPSKETEQRVEEAEQQAKDTLAMDSIPATADQTNPMDKEVPERPAPAAQLPVLTLEKKPEVPKEVAPVSNTEVRPDHLANKQPTPKTALQTIPLPGSLDRHRKQPNGKPDKSMGMSFPSLRPSAGNRINFGDIRIGFNVNPVFTDKGFSFGGGVSAQIPLSSRISAEIGANYSNLRVGVDMEADKTDTISQQTIGIRNSIGMVSIPVSLNYSITEHFSASLGLVPFRVVSDQRTDIRQSYQWKRGDILSGDTTLRLVGERTRSQRADSLYRGNSYLGFIQVSGRLSPPFLKKYNAVIAPFVAIPVGRLRDDEYRWLHGGVSFRIYLR